MSTLTYRLRNEVTVGSDTVTSLRLAAADRIEALENTIASLRTTTLQEAARALDEDGEFVRAVGFSRRILDLVDEPALRPIASAPPGDAPVILYRDYGDNSCDYWIGIRSRHGVHWIAQPDAKIIVPTHWAPLPDQPPAAPKNGNRGMTLSECPGYSPDLMAMGDCANCGHAQQSHKEKT